MDDRLLSYYNRELAYLRRLGAEFAEQHPKIAANLRLDRDEVDDPHVSRLVESFAFLTSRIRCTLDDSFPELTEALIGVMYPNFHAPYPSQSVVQLQLLKKLFHASEIPAGTLLYTQCEGIPHCFYRTRHKTTVLPADITKAEFSAHPLRVFPSNSNPRFRSVKPQSALSVTIEPYAEEGFKKLTDHVRRTPVKFYLNAQAHVAYLLYEYLFDRLVGVGVQAKGSTEPVVLLGPEHVRSCVFSHLRAARDEALGEFDGRGSEAHDWLRDYFGFPQQFLFFELSGLESVWEACASGFCLLFYFSDTHPELVQGVDHNTLLLGCTPITNVFPSRALTSNLMSLDRESRIEVDPQLHPIGDVHHIREVSLTNDRGARIVVPPYFGGHHDASETGLYWVMRRENSSFYRGNISHGTDAYLAFISESDAALDVSENWKVEVDVLCTNRDVPTRLPFGPYEPALSFYDKAGEGVLVKCLMAPTPTRQPRLGSSTGWQFISLITLQSFSGEDGLETLKRVLSLYDPIETASSASLVDGIIQLTTTPVSMRVTRHGRSAFCHGTRIILTVDQQYYTGNGVYVFGEVLSEFFGHLCSINSFTQLEIRVTQRPEEPFIWPACSGTEVLV